MCTKAKASWRDGLLVIDWFGTFSVLAVALILILGLDFGGAIFTWSSPKVISLVILGVLMMDFFLFTEKRLAKYPLMPMNVFQWRSNIVAFIVGTTYGIVSMGVEYCLRLFFQSANQAS